LQLRHGLYWRAGFGALLAALLLAVVVVSLTVGGGAGKSASALQAPGGAAGIAATETPCIPPANDDYNSSVKIKSLPFTDTVDTSCATEELFEARYCKPAGGTVWYTYSPRDDAILTVTGSGEVSVFYWVFYGGWDHCAYSETGSVTLPLSGSVGRQGLTYYIQVSASDGAVTVDIQPAPTPTPCPTGKVGSFYGCGTPLPTATPCVPPGNDAFANAKAITAQPFSETISTTCATWQEGERSCGNNHYSVWYAYTPSQSGVVQVDTFGTDFDTSLAVYTGNTLESLSQVACVDDAWPSDLSAVRFNAVAGQTYFIQAAEGYERGDLTVSVGPIRPVPPPFTATPTWTPCPTEKVAVYYSDGGCGTATPTFTPTSTPTPCPAGKVPYYLRCFTPTPTNTPCFAPANDDVANAIVVNSIPFTMSGSAHCATEQPGESAWSCGDDQSVWFRFTATSSETLHASLTGWHTSGNIFAGTKPVRCLDAWGGAAEGTFNAVEGVTYYFQITAHQYADGAYTFSLDVAPPPTPTQTPCAPSEGLYYDSGDYRCMTPTPTPTPCPAGKVLGYDYSTYPYQPFCGTPTPTFTPCPTEKRHDYSSVCGTATPTKTPCPAGKEVFNDGLYFPEQQRCGTATPTFTPCPAGSTPNYYYGGGCVTPTFTPTPCPTGKVLIYNYDLNRYDSCGTATPTFTPTLTPTPCPAGKVLFYDSHYPYPQHCGTRTPTPTPTPTCPAGKGSTFFGCVALPGDRSFLYLNDDSGNWWLLTDANVDFNEVTLAGGLFSLRAWYWDVRFQAPNGQSLEPATYSDATQWSYQPGNQPGMHVSSIWHRCFDGLTGAFTVESAAFRADYIESFRASFEQHCEGYPVLRGIVQMKNVSQPTATPTRTPFDTPTPLDTPTPCPSGKVPHYDGCATPTPTETPCPTHKVVYFDYSTYQGRCGTPTVTPTPCPIGKVPGRGGGCGTATATPSPRPPTARLDFSLGADTNEDGIDDCGTRADETAVCHFPPGYALRLHIYLNSLAYGSPPYEAVASHIYYTGVSSANNPDSSPWPDCVFEASASGPNFVNVGCTIGIGLPASTYTGLIAIADFRCTRDGDISLGHALGETLLARPGGAEMRETGSDLLSIVCDAQPIPTRTPTPPTTSTSTPATPDSHGGPPGMALSVYGDAAKQQLVCGNGALHRTCGLGASSAFSVDVETDAGPPKGFQGYQTVIQYSGAINLVDQSGLAENRWPRCGGQGFEQTSAPSNAAPGRYILGCATSQAAQTYEGALANVHFVCKGEGTGLISIVGGGGAHTSFYHRPSINGNRTFLAGESSAGQDLADAVVVQCGTTIDSGGAGGFDTDGDGCSDAREQGDYERTGGRRDALNPWDFFDLTGDKKHRIDDVLAVIDSYYIDDGAADYVMGADRTLLGPGFWNLGPPNGLVRVDDILSNVKLYFHDCG